MLSINANIRRRYNKSANRRLRSVGKLPAIIYGGNIAPIVIELDHNKIWNMQIQNKIKFYKEIITIFIDGKEKEIVKVQAIQRHAYKPKLVHIDFIRSF